MYGAARTGSLHALDLTHVDDPVYTGGISWGVSESLVSPHHRPLIETGAAPSRRLGPQAERMPSPSILLNDFKRQWADTGADVLAAVERVGASGWYILGRHVESFEHALAAVFGRRHAVGCASGLDAIEIGLRAAGLAAGDRVLTTPVSAFATTLAIVRAGGVPVFVDVDASGLVDLALCEQLLLGGTAIRFFVPVHLYGQSLDLERLAWLRDRFQLTIVEDCAQSVLARFGDAPAGSVGQIAATSFYPTKNLGALGDGGAVVTDDAGLARRAACLRHYGQSAQYVHDHLGLNSRLDELHAAILEGAFLPRLESWTTRRRVIAARYLAGIRHPRVRLLAPPPASQPCWHLFPVFVAAPDRTGFRQHLEGSGIQTALHYPHLIPDQRGLAQTPYEVHGTMNRAQQLAAEEISLPIHPYLLDDEVERVIAAVNSWPDRRPSA
jgi:dTDP-4-amino-4,6-dideoxygalactose transaminase